MPGLLVLNGPVGSGQANDPNDVYAFDHALREIGAYGPPPEYSSEPQRYPTAPMIDALERFQDKEGLKVDRYANPGAPTERAINNKLLNKPRGAGLLYDPIGPLSDTVGNGFANDRRDVQNVQRGLGTLGYMPEDPFDRPHGYIDAVTTNAIERFQDDNALAADGWLAPHGETETALRRAIADLQRSRGGEWRAFARANEQLRQVADDSTEGDAASPSNGDGEVVLAAWPPPSPALVPPSHDAEGAPPEPTVEPAFWSLLLRILGAGAKTTPRVPAGPRPLPGPTMPPRRTPDPKEPGKYPLPPPPLPDIERPQITPPQLGGENKPGAAPRDGFQGVPDPGGYRDVSETIGAGILGIVTSGPGRRGTPATHEQIQTVLEEIIREAKARGCEVIHFGGGRTLTDKGPGENKKEPWLRPRLPQKRPDGSENPLKGGSFADLGIEGPDGRRLYVNTYDVLRSIFKPTKREAVSADRLLFNARQGDFLLMLPKLDPNQYLDPEKLKALLRLMLDRICLPAAAPDDKLPGDPGPYYPPNDPRRRLDENKQ